MQTHPLLDFAFLFSSHKSAFFFPYMGFSFMRKAQMPLQAIATFAWFIKTKSEDLSLLAPSPSFGHFL